MSKMSQLHAELSEQAYELGYLSLDQALADGYEVDYRTSRLEKSVDGRELAGYGVDWDNAKLIKIEEEQDKAHEAWVKERDKLLNDLDVVAHSDAVPFEHKEIVKQAIEFIRGVKSE